MMIRYWPICHLKIKLIPTFLCRYNIFYGNISDLRLATFCASRLFLPFARQTRPYDTSANFWAFDTCPAWDEVHDNHKKSACSPWGEALLVWGSQARWHWDWTPTCQKVIIVCSWIVKVLVVVNIIIVTNLELNVTLDKCRMNMKYDHMILDVYLGVKTFGHLKEILSWHFW